MRRLTLGFCAIPACILASSVFGASIPVASSSMESNTNSSINFFPGPFRATAWGLGGNRNVGVGDAMQPLLGNDSGMFYADLQGKYAYDSNWLMSAGGGYRYIYDCARIFGAYVFADHNEFKNTGFSTSSFWMVSPGIESLGNIWDFRINGYIPVTSQTENKGNLFGDQLGITNVMFFQGHSQFDQLYTVSNNVGPGIDGEIGYAIPFVNHNTRVYLGGYYFSPKNTTNIRGISGRVEFPLNHYFALTAADTYDNNVNNSFEAGLRVTIGGNTDDQTSKDIARRIVDPIPRNLATLSQGTGAPVVTTTKADGLFLELGNIYFFTPDSGAALSASGTSAGDPTANVGSSFNLALGNNNCTIENPCQGLSQTAIDGVNALAANANFYLSPGTYNNPNQGSAFSFRSGQNVFGRTSDYTQLAVGDSRAFLDDSIFLEGSNNVFNLRVNGHSVRDLETGGALVPFQVGALVRSFARGPVNIVNSELLSNDPATPFLNIIAVANNSRISLLTISNSTMISDNGTQPGTISVGAGNLNTGTLTINNSSITLRSSDTVNNFDLAFGVVNNESGPVKISNSSILINAINGGLATGILDNSSLGLGLGTITLDHSTITVNGTGFSLVAGVFNQANNPDGVSAKVNINRSTISVTSNNNGGGNGVGVGTSGTGVVTIANSVISSTGDSGSIAGLAVSDPTGTLNFLNSTVSVNTSGTAVGMITSNAGTINNIGGNQCFQNGLSVPCT